jgi:hypothetical protein
VAVGQKLSGTDFLVSFIENENSPFLINYLAIFGGHKQCVIEIHESVYPELSNQGEFFPNFM